MEPFHVEMFTKAFSAQLMELPESKLSLLPYATSKGSFKGEEAYFNQIGSLEASTGRTRNGKHEHVEGEYARRRVVPELHYISPMLDSFDQVKSLVDPRSALSMRAKQALIRKLAQQMLEAAYGTSYTGKAGATSETFDSTDIVAATVGKSSGNAGLNADKIVYALEKVQKTGIDLTDPAFSTTLILSPELVRDAKLDTKLANRDYMKDAILSGLGLPQGFMGINNIIVDPACPYANTAVTGINAVWQKNGLAVDTVGVDIRMATLVVKAGVGYGQWEDSMVRVTEIEDQHFDWQMYARVVYGMTRMLPNGGVIGIACDQSPAA